MLLVVEDHTVVDLISEAKHVELDTQFGNLGQFLPREHLADGVVRSIDDDSFSLGPERGSEFVEIDLPVGA